MKEYSIIFKNGDEEHSTNKEIIKSICKEHKKEEVEQVFWKEYENKNGFWEEVWCELLFCSRRQEIWLNGVKFKEDVLK